MKFFVTEDYEIIDPQNAYDRLSMEEQTNLLYNARDIYEKNMGEWTKQPPWPKIVVKKGSRETSLGVLES